MTGLDYAVMVLLILIGLAARWLVYRKPGRPHRRADKVKQPVVTVIVRRPILPVPSLADAYSALPPHCWQVLSQ